jgi:hypothetical protein
MNLDIRENIKYDDIDTIINACSTDKLMRERCNKASFWKPIFERHHLIYPFSVSNMKDWIKLYNISSILTPMIEREEFTLTVNGDDELADISIYDLKLSDLYTIFDIEEINNTYYMYKYLKINTDLPEQDIISIIYDLQNIGDVDFITFYYYEEFNKWGVNIQYGEEYISFLMSKDEMIKSVFKLLLRSKFEQLNFDYIPERNIIYKK